MRFTTGAWILVILLWGCRTDEPAVRCYSDLDCSGGSVCEKGYCAPLCVTDGDCPDDVPCVAGICEIRGPACGDGVLDEGEWCDAGLDNSWEAGTCRPDCTLPRCTDGVLDPDELCDDGNDVSGDGCDANCTPTACGNGVVSGEEECDQGTNNSDTTPDACRTDCRAASCGDGILDSGEACDDANPVEGDGCDTNCTVSMCGNGVVDPSEQCDDGSNNSDEFANACRTDCTLPRCGDGVKDSGEACDDGNQIPDDGCEPGCLLANCGDGEVEGEEECDDGMYNSDVQPNACRMDCTYARCGDGVIDEGEGCDEGPLNSNEAPAVCRTNCVLASCGDGVLDAGEQCDSATLPHATCIDCLFGCVLGYADCDSSAANGCEIPLQTASNCAACGHACVGGGTCSAGQCSPLGVASGLEDLRDIAINSSHLYASIEAEIIRMPKASGPSETFTTGWSYYGNLWADDQRVYFHGNPSTVILLGKLGRKPTAGGAVVNLATADLVLDGALGQTHFYYTLWLGGLRRIPHGASAVEYFSPASSGEQPQGLALGSGTVVWSTNSGSINGSLRIAQQEGETSSVLVPNQVAPGSVAVSQGIVFWNNYLEGSDVTELWAVAEGGGLPAFLGAVAGRPFDLVSIDGRAFLLVQTQTGGPSGFGEAYIYGATPNDEQLRTIVGPQPRSVIAMAIDEQFIYWADRGAMATNGVIWRTTWPKW